MRLELIASNQVSAQSAVTVAKPKTERVKDNIAWAIAAQMNMSGLRAAALGPQPGSFGWAWDGVNLDGENVNPGVAFLPYVQQIVYLPPFVHRWLRPTYPRIYMLRPCPVAGHPRRLESPSSPLPDRSENGGGEALELVVLAEARAVWHCAVSA